MPIPPTSYVNHLDKSIQSGTPGQSVTAIMGIQPSDQTVEQQQSYINQERCMKYIDELLLLNHGPVRLLQCT